MSNIIKNILVVTVLTVSQQSYSAQHDQSPPDEKRETTIDLVFYKKADSLRSVVATVHAKNSLGKFGPAKNAKVNFYTIKGKEEILIESVYSDNRGEAALRLPKELPPDENRFFTVVAKIVNDSLYEDTEEKLRFRDASLKISFNPNDTSRLVTVKVMETDSGGKELPVKNLSVKFYVQRLFGIMPAVEDNSIITNENGEASFAYPGNIHGDTGGNITLVVRIEDDEQFGNIEKRAAVCWGTILAVNRNPFPRALWEPDAPIPLVITVSTLFLSVWLIYFFIFYNMRKIRKEKNAAIVKGQDH